MDPSDIEGMGLNTTDAYPDSVVECSEHSQNATITLEVLKQIEWELEEFEKLSVVFLLAGENPAAYSTVLTLCRNMKERPCIISEFVQNNPEVWSKKLIEAFCIIDNREVLENLGYPKPDELLKSHLVSIARYTSALHPAVKVLYKLFESMDSEKSKQFLENVYKDCQRMRELEDTRYLELHALYWLQEGYIRISPDGSADLKNLLKHLKQLNYYDESIYNDVEYVGAPLTRVLDDVDSSSQGMRMPIRQYLTCLNNDALPTKGGLTRIINKGLCLIINQVKFSRRFETRHGSNYDRDNLEKAFKRRNFDILIQENLDKCQTKQALREVSDKFDVEKYDCLVVCILSHGYKGGVITCDGQEIPNDDIENDMCTVKLSKVVKVLIVQACQGENIGSVAAGRPDLATDGCKELNFGTHDRSELELSSDGPSADISRYDHFSRFMSTMGGFKSIRNKREGTWFIKAICDVLSESGSISIPDWVTKVIANVKKNKGNVDGVKSASQRPEFTTRQDMIVYFPPYTNNEATEVAVIS